MTWGMWIGWVVATAFIAGGYVLGWRRGCRAGTAEQVRRQADVARTIAAHRAQAEEGRRHDPVTGWEVP